MTDIAIYGHDNIERLIRNRLKEYSNKPGVSLGRQIHSVVLTNNSAVNSFYIFYCKKNNTIWIDLNRTVIFTYQDKNILNSYCALMEFLDNNINFI